ncbi:MAG: FliM/FliN family flagellar motor switch protein [Armatimonadetes bacterium]|nr:FliM/FliN family flagellar motor switch protein [Armatimonadota bacterium]
MLDVPMEVTVEIDRVQLSLAEVLALQPGSVVQLSRVPGEPLDLLVNGRPVARGEIVVVNDVFAFRVVEIISRGSVAQKAA